MARVNGELVGKAPKARVDKRRWNDDIAWFITEARGELGEKGMAIDPTGGGSRNPADTWPLHETRLQAGPAVRKWRRLWSVWAELSQTHQRTLFVRYRDQERQHTEIRGLRAAFGDLAGLAWELCADDEREGLRERLSHAGAKRDAGIDALRRKSEAANRAAHIAWQDVEMTVILDGTKRERAANAG